MPLPAHLTMQKNGQDAVASGGFSWYTERSLQERMSLIGVRASECCTALLNW
jgi:hypothetical protein